MRQALIFLTVVLASLSLATPALASGDVVDLPVKFDVQNVNRSKVPCLSNGGDYTISGHLVAPRPLLVRPGARPVTLYVHGVALGEPIWRFQGLPGYDYPYELARLGHASVTIDLLGFGASGTPNGSLVCIGSQADMLHQIVSALRTGRYDAVGHFAPSFQRVALAGHSYGGLIAPVEAYSFHDVDALLTFGSAWEQGVGQSAAVPALSAIAAMDAVCAPGGEPKRPGARRGYVRFADDATIRSLFYNADPSVVETIVGMHEREPCGDLMGSFNQTLVLDRLYMRTISVPVFQVFGDHDIVFPPSFADGQAQAYSGSPEVTTAVIANAGHVLQLQRTAPAFHETVAAWLEEHGL